MTNTPGCSASSSRSALIDGRKPGEEDANRAHQPAPSSSEREFSIPVPPFCGLTTGLRAQPPVAVLREPEHAVDLAVRQAELHRGLALLVARADLGRGCHHEDVGGDHAGDVTAPAVLRRVPRADDVHPVTGLQRSVQHLVLVACELDDSLHPLDARPHPGGRNRPELARRHRLAGEDVLRRDLARDRLRRGDRVGRDRALRYLLRHQCAVLERGARRTGIDVLGGEEHADEAPSRRPRRCRSAPSRRRRP